MARNKSTQSSQAAAADARPSEDPRTHHDSDLEARGSRAEEDTPRTNDEGTALSLEERRAMIRNEFLQEALPKAPSIPGFHCCWLSTTNSYDPIHKRMRLGYTPVSADEVRGFESLKAASGEFPGAVACNEMVLFKIPMETYMMIMQEFHHIMPANEEEAIRAQLVRGEEDSEGKKLGQVEGDGYETFGSKAPAQGKFAAV